MESYNSLDSLTQRCESEKLHLSGAIQPFGALVVIDSATMTVSHASANLQNFVGIGPDQVLGKPVENLKWLDRTKLAALPEQPGQRLHLKQLTDCVGHVTGLAIRGTDTILVEVEDFLATTEPLPIQQLQSPLLTVPYDNDEVAQHHHMLVRAVREITHYDRIMIYHFHEDWSGEVIAEDSPASLGSYLGLRFPASDIPAIARNLYLLNPIRLIPDAKTSPVPVIGLNSTPPDPTCEVSRLSTWNT
jgi:two-component system, chemotaxis family, sensor kinase Cph1